MDSSRSLTPGQANALIATERVVSVFSIIGILFILITFYFLRSFNKPINRLVFYASFGNLGMNIACLISENGPNAGSNSSLCQFQAFLIQMFLGVDAFWSCCMAWNVYLAFFRKYTDRQLRSLDKWYFLGCYGASFVPALTFLFIDTSGRGKIYGDAVLWCWIDLKWDFLRIALLYGIVWIAIIFAIGIYIRAGRVIYKRRDQLKGFLNPMNENPFTGVVTTEIDVTIEPVQSPSQTSTRHGNVFDKDFDRIPGMEEGDFDPYTVNIGVGENEHNRKPSSKPELFRMKSITREEAMKETTNPGAWLYARVAFLFFLSLLIIWIPSSANRVYSLVHPTRINYPLNYLSALVLPMQGLLNAIVYIITSQTACRDLWHAMFSLVPGTNRVVGGGGGGGFKRFAGMNKKKNGKRNSRRGGHRGSEGSMGDCRRKSFHMLDSRVGAGGSEVSIPMVAHTV
ncbi:MAG: hypothetical protein Q9186_000138 [Xanthomendoza sp. 1 TL-2023]